MQNIFLLEFCFLNPCAQAERYELSAIIFAAFKKLWYSICFERMQGSHLCFMHFSILFWKVHGYILGVTRFIHSFVSQETLTVTIKLVERWLKNDDFPFYVINAEASIFPSKSDVKNPFENIYGQMNDAFKTLQFDIELHSWTVSSLRHLF